jgi:mono/diheme cytochrome c family protein
MGKKTSGSLAVTLVLTQVLGMAVAESPSPGSPKWTPLSVELPVSTRTFPPGEGASIASAQCLICHSAGMVLFQPQRTRAQWTETINKMRTAYGAPLPAEQVDALAAYLASVVGHDSGTQSPPPPRA